MKKTIVLLSFLNMTFFYAQFNTSSYSANQESQNLRAGVARDNLIDSKGGYKIEGTPFIYNNYAKASILDSSPSTFIRYNAMKDEIEVKEGSNVIVLPKEEKLGKINLADTNEKIRLETFTYNKKSYTGYLFLLLEKENFSFYKKEKTILTKEKEATNAYQESKPAKYVAQKPEFFIKINNEIVEFPKNKKKLIELLPAKKAEIEKMSSGLNFSKEEDVIRLLNSL